MPERLDYPVGDKEFGQVVQLSDALRPIPVRGGGAPVGTIDFLWKASYEGKVWVAGDADQNDVVTGQTSFAATTPTFMIDVPSGITCVPLFVDLMQTGTVAGGDIELLFEIDRIKRYSSGGTAEKAFNPQFKTAKCVLYSGATALTGYGMTLSRYDLAPDVSPAEGAVNKPFWTPPYPVILRGPASFLIYSSAGTTGPTWFWNVGWMELTEAELANYLGTYTPESPGV